MSDAATIEEVTITRVRVLEETARGPLARGLLATIIAEQLSDDEFERLAPREAQVVALRRLWLSYGDISRALDVCGPTVSHAFYRARGKGVTP